MNKQIQIFKPGKHVTMSGDELSFSEADLIATAKAYNPALHEAPLVIGHPKADLPRYGGVASLAYGSGILDASPKDVAPEFAEWVGRKLYNTVSASFYSPTSTQNPVPGVWYLRHVGFLGAQPPAIKGLNQNGISFAAKEEGVVEFADWDDVQNASLWRRLRDWLIGEKGLAVADNIIPDYAVASLEQAAMQEDDDASSTPASQFSETPTLGDEMSAEDKARLAALEAENKALKDKQIEFAEADKKTKADARHADHVAFAEGLIKAGKLLPAEKDIVVANLDFIESADTSVEFGEADKKQPLAKAFKTMLEAQLKKVEFSELAGGKGETGDVEKDPTTIAAAAVEFQESEAAAGRVVNSAQAVQHVMNKAKA